MQLFTVPQFIDVEDKIIGPLTVRQFIILLSGVIVAAIGYKLFDLPLFIAFSVLCLIVFGSFAFIRINGRPFHYFVLNFIQTAKKTNLRVWNHRNPVKDLLLSEEDSEGKEIQSGTNIPPPKARPAGSRLRELSLIVDTKGVYKGGEDEEEIIG